jgi:6-pyruvoyltetrahydropterin/6-carboxytetrahydropterin synthase
MKVSKTFTFHSAHFLPNHPTCGKMHGHTYKLEVTLEGRNLFGIVADFKTIAVMVEFHVVDKLDHRLLNDILSYPTAENIAQWIWKQVQRNMSRFFQDKVKLISVKLWETETSMVEYNGD